MSAAPSTPEMSRELLSLREALPVWARIALLSFGGPAGQIAVMHRILVDEKRWIGEQRFLHALNFCMLLPGPEAQQLATYIGWLMHGVRGGLVAGGLFIVPGVLAILLLSLVYVTWGYSDWFAGLLLGLKAAVVALIVQALFRIAGRALKDRISRGLAVLSFLAIWLMQAPFPLIIIGASVAGVLLARAGLWHPAAAGHGSSKGPATTAPPLIPESALTHGDPTVGRSLRVLSTWLALWFIPLAALAWLAGPRHVLTDVAVFFSKMAVVTFGGAYAVLVYVAQQAVEHYHWVTPAQMLDGLGFAESTPGPLIMVVQFVGFMAAYQAGTGAPMLAALVGAAVTVWVTFVPCFMWIFLGAPYVERLRANRALSAGLSAITAAVVGVIANLALWFTIHALFATQTTITPAWLPRGIDLPLLSSIRWDLAILIAVALGVTFGLRWGLGRLLAICGVLGLAFVLLARLGS